MHDKSNLSVVQVQFEHESREIDDRLKPLSNRADSVFMDSDLQRACVKAGVKLGIGMGLLAAVIGIRVITTTSDGVEAGVEALERLKDEIAAESASGDSGRERPSSKANDSIASRLSAGLRERLPGGDFGSRDGDKLVSCRFGATTRFMRADDCAMRGGESTVFEDDR